MKQRNELADAALVAAVANALREWREATGREPSLKPLREAVWFYWQSPRLPKPLVRGKYPKAFPWSPAARAAYRADPQKCQLIIEHTEPLNLVVRRVVNESPLSAEAVRDVLPEGLASVNPCDNRLLSAAGVANNMPPGWHPGEDPWARYRAAGLDVDDFGPLNYDFG